MKEMQVEFGTDLLGGYRIKGIEWLIFGSMAGLKMYLEAKRREKNSIVL